MSSTPNKPGSKEHVNVPELRKLQGKPFGAFTLSGIPGKYTLKRGLTGRTIASGSKQTILVALQHLLADETPAKRRS